MAEQANPTNGAMNLEGRTPPMRPFILPDGVSPERFEAQQRAQGAPQIT